MESLPSFAARYDFTLLSFALSTRGRRQAAADAVRLAHAALRHRVSPVSGSGRACTSSAEGSAAAEERRRQSKVVITGRLNM